MWIFWRWRGCVWRGTWQWHNGWSKQFQESNTRSSLTMTRSRNSTARLPPGSGRLYLPLLFFLTSIRISSSLHSLHIGVWAKYCWGVGHFSRSLLPRPVITSSLTLAVIAYITLVFNVALHPTTILLLTWRTPTWGGNEHLLTHLPWPAGGSRKSSLEKNIPSALLPEAKRELACGGRIGCGAWLCGQEVWRGCLLHPLTPLATTSFTVMSSCRSSRNYW